jgi:hypothetical protein
MIIGVLGCLICGALIPCERSKKAYNYYYKEWNRKHLGLEARIEAWNKGGEDPYLWDDVKESSLHDKVKFTPSVAIINHGEVKKWLQADRDEDSEFFNSGEALQRWISDNIEF